MLAFVSRADAHATHKVRCPFPDAKRHGHPCSLTNLCTQLAISCVDNVGRQFMLGTTHTSRTDDNGFISDGQDA